MEAIAEASIFLSSLAFLLTFQDWALLIWLIVGGLYVIGGFAAVWRADPIETDESGPLRSAVHWFWASPLLAATIGAVSAVAALAAKSDLFHPPENVLLTLASSSGVLLSWILLQVGFAQMYLALDLTSEREDLRFPDGAPPSILNYLYFSFTVGASFATSDVEVVSFQIRRLILIHAVASFFYNALVVAVAFQVLQGLISR